MQFCFVHTPHPPCAFKFEYAYEYCIAHVRASYTVNI